MEEINLKELFDYVKERILLIIIVTLAILVLGCIYSFFVKTPMYKSDTTLVLVSDDGSAGSGSGYTQSDVNLNKSLVTTYSEILVSRRILEPVIRNLALDYSYDYLKGNVTVSTVKDTEVIKIVVTDVDKVTAANIANEIVKVFGEEIKSIYKLQNVSIVDYAKESENPYNINIVKDLLIYILVGLVISFGAIFVVYYFDSTIKSAEEIENKLGLPVIGIVPKVKSKMKR